MFGPQQLDFFFHFAWLGVKLPALSTGVGKTRTFVTFVLGI
jgi:hypothetical protein